jgi:hypothetical protein
MQVDGGMKWLDYNAYKYDGSAWQIKKEACRWVLTGLY